MKPKLIIVVGLLIAGIFWAGYSFAACIFDPVGYWTLDQAAPPFINEMLDEYAGSCGGTGGTECPTPDANGQIGAALEFNGSDEGLSVADDGDAIFDFENGESFSISVWFRRQGFASWENNEVLVGRYAFGQAHFWVGLENGTGRARFRLWDNIIFGDSGQGIITDTRADADLSDNNWHHIVAVRNAEAGQILLYVDGARVQSREMIYTGTFTADTDMHIGWMEEGTYYFNGTIDEVTLFNEALSDDIIAQIYTAGNSGNPICADNLPPNITSTAPTTATVGVEYTYNPTAEDPDNPDNDPLLWSLENAPDSMVIDEMTGAITWTPPEGTTTSGLVTLMVSDGIDGTDSEEFTITVGSGESGSEPQPESDNGGGGSGGGGCFIGGLME